MLVVIAMALSVHDALHGGSAQFALAYVALAVLMLLLSLSRESREAPPADLGHAG